MPPTEIIAMDVQMKDGRTVRLSARSAAALLSALVDVQAYEAQWAGPRS